MIKSTHGGYRAGAGRKPAPREADKQLMTVYAWLTPDEHETVNDALDATERATVLLQAAAARANGKRGGRPKKSTSAQLRGS